MSRKYKFCDPNELYFVTYTLIYWIDLFIRNEYKDIMLASWRHCQQFKGLDIYGWCIMTSHVHMIIGASGNRPENIMRDMKRHTSEKLREAIIRHPGESRKKWLLEMMEKKGKENCHNRDFQLWQQDSHPIQLFSLKVAHQKLNYTHYNPVVAGIVEKPEDYLYSSARNYIGMKGLIDVNLLDPLLRL